MRYLDTCDTIYNFFWDNVAAKRFQPFWWSPITALNDMSEVGLAFVDGKLIETPAYGWPVKRKYDYMDREVTFVEHYHDEPMHYSFNAEKYLKGCKNAYFKYASEGIDICKPLYQAGMLSRKPEMFEGREIIPFDFFLAHIPPAPKDYEEVKAIYEEGLESDGGATSVEVYGKKDGKDICVEVHIFQPSYEEAFKMAGATSEMYMTGQAGYCFSKMFVNGDFDQTGVISADMFTMQQCDKYFEYAAECGITIETRIKKTTL